MRTDASASTGRNELSSATSADALSDVAAILTEGLWRHFCEGSRPLQPPREKDVGKADSRLALPVEESGHATLPLDP